MGLFDGTPWERPVTCERCEKPLAECQCPRNAKGEICLPKKQSPRVRREKRKKGKVVTIVDGLDSSATDLSALLKQLKTSLGTGGTVTENRIELQGDCREPVLETLKKMGYAAKLAGG